MNALRNLSERDRRALLILAAAAVVILATRFALLPALDGEGGGSSSNVAVREKLLRKYRGLSAAAPSLAAGQHAALKNVAEAEKGLLKASTAAEAGDEVQRELRQLAASAEIQIRSLDFLPLKKTGEGYPLAPVSLQFTAKIEQLTAFLAAIESSSHILMVDQVRIAAANEMASEGPRKRVNVALVVNGVTAERSTPGGKP